MRGGRGRGRGGRRLHDKAGRTRRPTLPWKLQRELGIETEEEVKGGGGRGKPGKGGRREKGPREKGAPRPRGEPSSSQDPPGRRGDDGAEARKRRMREDNEKDERLRRSLAKKLKMKSADAKFGLDDGLNDVLEGLPIFGGGDSSSSGGDSGSDDVEGDSSSPEYSLSEYSSEEEVGEEVDVGARSPSSRQGGASSSGAPVGRYIPPGLRKKTDSLDNGIARKVRGLLNRITESSVQNIACEIATTVETHRVKKKVIQELICQELIRSAVEGPRASAQFAAVTSSCIFGLAAQLGSSELVAKFAAVLAEKIEAALQGEDGRALHNLVLTLVHLGNIGALPYSTIFSFLFHLKETFGVAEVECIYTVLRFVGSPLRTSDPTRMKEFVISVHEKAGRIRSSSNGGSLSQKQEILLKSVVDIKNNRQRGNFGRGCHPISPNLSSWFKSAKATELCLQNLSWHTLLSPDKRGLWWLEGSDLKSANEKAERELERAKRWGSKATEQSGVDYMKIASEQRMNTEIRRSIFVVIMSSEDYVDAFERLVGLGLKGSQEREISRVLLHCCIQEAAYNPYYFYIAKSLIKQSKQQKLSFIFTISDKLKELSKLSARSIANISKLVAALVKGKLLPFTIIKALSISGNVNKKEALFLQMLLEMYLLASSEDAIHEQLLTLYMRPEYKTLKTSLSMYIIKFFPKYLKHSKMEADDLKDLKVKSAVALKALSGNAL
ncbi:MIF4G domain-containing protein [Chloropicon primus]|uniref:MIF4G domain-containing protein n=2 Tax=Chloropicon primus TaxID=1764295 RepID=A0A5B8MUH6_9CHLO|nr:MIF4G domain-containing protein [Chloropicon primus]UPR02316.1 MIF4G domain-containing protein [Chloropicon primus]|eukprot:QDZ23102.1 MIF4G domain-containing protein [Chloropicon primus]